LVPLSVQQVVVTTQRMIMMVPSGESVEMVSAEEERELTVGKMTTNNFLIVVLFAIH
jgi:hypothetical protein